MTKEETGTEGPLYKLITELVFDYASKHGREPSELHLPAMMGWDLIKLLLDMKVSFMDDLIRGGLQALAAHYFLGMKVVLSYDKNAEPRVE